MGRQSRQARAGRSAADRRGIWRVDVRWDPSSGSVEGPTTQTPMAIRCLSRGEILESWDKDPFIRIAYVMQITTRRWQNTSPSLRSATLRGHGTHGAVAQVS